MKLIPLSLLTFTLSISHIAYADTVIKDEKDVHRIIKEYLLENPEILYEMQDILIQKESSKQKESLSDGLNILIQDSNIPALGNTKDPKVTLTEFMDYSCSYCRLMWPDLKKLSDKYPELQIKVVNLPILGEASELLADYSLSFWQLYPEKWEKFHDKIISSKNTFSIESLENLTKSLEGDWDKLSKAVEKKVAFNTIYQSIEIANTAGIKGTPFYAIGVEEFYPGAVGYKQLDKAIKEYLKKAPL